MGVFVPVRVCRVSPPRNGVAFKTLIKSVLHVLPVHKTPKPETGMNVPLCRSKFNAQNISLSFTFVQTTNLHLDF